MNPQLKFYSAEVDDVDAPPAEKLQTLFRRDTLHAESLDTEELVVLRDADLRLLENLHAFVTCTDFAKHRHQRSIDPRCWWWYLDALAHVPRPSLSAPH